MRRADLRSRGLAALETNGRYQRGGGSSERASERRLRAGSGHHAYCGQGPFCPLSRRLAIDPRTPEVGHERPNGKVERELESWDQASDFIH